MCVCTAWMHLLKLLDFRQYQSNWGHLVAQEIWKIAEIYGFSSSCENFVCSLNERVMLLIRFWPMSAWMMYNDSLKLKISDNQSFLIEFLKFLQNCHQTSFNLSVTDSSQFFYYDLNKDFTFAQLFSENVHETHYSVLKHIFSESIIL